MGRIVVSNYSEGKLQLEAKNTSWTKVFNFVPEGSTVLDVGCSDGQLGRELKARKNCTVYGIEIDPSDVAKAKKVLDGVFSVNLETEAIPTALASKHFDAILLVDVIEHFVHPSETLVKLKGLLNDGGRIIFSIPNMSHISVRLQLLNGRLIYNEIGLLDKTHLHFYDSEEATRVLHDAGLQIVKTDANSLPYPPSFLREKLSALGLHDAGFIARIQKDIDAQTFQFVGYATDAKQANLRKIPLTTTTPELELTDYIEALKASLDDAVKQVAIERAAKDRQQVEAEALRERLNIIEQSTAWKVASRVSRAAGKVGWVK